jgi:hypothetical protein
MVDSYNIINARLSKERLPPLNYRISGDYGPVELVESERSKGYDLFGPVMNICAKINSRKPTNGIATRSSLHRALKSLKISDHDCKTISQFDISAGDLKKRPLIQHILNL